MQPTDPVFAGLATTAGSPGPARCAGAACNDRKESEGAFAELGIDPSTTSRRTALRRTYASLPAAMREDPVNFSEQLGHSDARFTFCVD